MYVCVFVYFVLLAIVPGAVLDQRGWQRTKQSSHGTYFLITKTKKQMYKVPLEQNSEGGEEPGPVDISGRACKPREEKAQRH